MKYFNMSISKTKITLTLVIIVSLFFIAACKRNQPLITWEKTYGGGSRDRAYSIKQSSDNGYFVAAQSSSFGAGGYDYYIIKLNEMGNKSWEKTFGGESAEIPRCINKTNDGGCVVAGRTSSFGPAYCDFYIVKLDQNGGKNWEKVYGGDSWDDLWSIQQTTDGGYVAAGFTESMGAGGYDVYVMKLDGGGEKIWEKTYGGSVMDAANCIQQTADGGYIVAGFTESIGAGSWDVYILKLDGSGEKIWEKTYGGTFADVANAIQQTADGGYIVAGFTESIGAGGRDVYIIKLDGSGERVWEKTFGGILDDEALSIHQNKDKSYTFAGYIGSRECN